MSDTTPTTLPQYISPSQVATAGRCGWAWQHQYKWKTQPQKTGVFLLVGSVLHNAREKWALDHSLDMEELVREAWLEELKDEPAMVRVVSAYRRLSEKSIACQSDILRARPDIKAPAMTKDYKTSPVGIAIKNFAKTNEATLTRAQHDWSKHDFCAAYDDTLLIAQRYQDHYQYQHPSIRTEIRYQVDHNGLILVGIIDDVSLLVTENGECLGYIIIDAKSYGKVPYELKDFLQLASYHIAATHLLPAWLDDAGIAFDTTYPIYVGIDMMRTCELLLFQLNDTQLAMAEGILRTYNNWRGRAGLLPNFKGCDFCEFEPDCSKLIGLQRLNAA